MKKKIIATFMIILAAVSLVSCTRDNKKVKVIEKDENNSAKVVSFNKKDYIDVEEIKKDLDNFSNIVEDYKNIEKDLEKDLEKEAIKKIKDKKTNSVTGNVNKVTGTLKEIINK